MKKTTQEVTGEFDDHDHQIHENHEAEIETFNNGA